MVMDKNIYYQQNVDWLPCTMVVLDVFRNILFNLVTITQHCKK